MRDLEDCRLCQGRRFVLMLIRQGSRLTPSDLTPDDEDDRDLDDGW
ncbi:MAG TPA: hypothetical protein VNQ33_05830 [Acidimicrobiales bacterium]|nr:hypothetical protein [Acidimicrobiales bacterium]